MPLKHACFISYRHGQKALAERIVNDLHDALFNELEVLVDCEEVPVAIDRERLKGGMFYNEALASTLCESACMIVVFTPIYFSKTHTYCAREYKAMEALEEKRLALMGNPLDKQNGLIIPIVFRGLDSLPNEIKQRRQYYCFDGFLLSDEKLSKNRQYARKIKELAEYIAARFNALTNIPGGDPCKDCHDFALPSANEIEQWLGSVTSAGESFVLREKAANGD
jgi:hypothetical protein